ncbi:AmmeMemoRadiSam system radical SAM enzyme [Candidatus Bathyarchaeota archaeon]|nr:AmmeMemoRadiSam system radical SAM enzyme [Candidatus Bathyarchaeota archaeon]
MQVTDLLNYPNVHEAVLYRILPHRKVECGTCERRCMIAEDQLGFCKTRQNIDGRLYTLVYGDISSSSANPIEKKPFFHFWPGSYALTIGTWSCNFTCLWCQNFDITKFPPNPRKATYISPKKLIDITLRKQCQGTSISFNEPTLLFEYSLDVFRLARSKSLYNTYVSNGYLTLEALRMLKDAGLDAIKFDIKGDKEVYRKYCAADVSIVWRNIAEAKRLGLHVEIVTLIIPGVNDDEDCIKEIVHNHLKAVGPQTPLHFTQYYPAYKFSAPRTPVKTLENAHAIAKREGVQYVYVGNVPGHKWENTYCHNCGELLIERYIFSVTRYRLTSGNRCPNCGIEIPIIGNYVKSPL